MIRWFRYLVILTVGAACCHAQQPPTPNTPAAAGEDVAATTAPAAAPTTDPPASGEGVAVDRLSTQELMIRARAAIKERKLRDAQGMFALALGREPDNLEIKLIGAEIAEANNDSENSRRFYREILAVDPAHFEANFRMGRSFNAANWWRQAVFYLEKAARIAPADRLSEVLTQLARGLHGEKRIDEALKAVENAIKQAPDNLEARGLQILIRIDQKQYDQALAAAKALEEIARAAVQNAPNDPDALRKLLDANQLILQSIQYAVAALQQLDSRGLPTDRPLPGKEREIASLLIQATEALTRESAIRQLLAKHDSILPLAERAVQYDPDNLRANVNLAVVYFDTANFERCAEVCRRILELDPQNADARRLLQTLGISTGNDAPADNPPAASPSPPATPVGGS